MSNKNKWINRILLLSIFIAPALIAWILTSFIAYDVQAITKQVYWRIIFIMITAALTWVLVLIRKDFNNELKEGNIT